MLHGIWTRAQVGLARAGGWVRGLTRGLPLVVGLAVTLGAQGFEGIPSCAEFTGTWGNEIGRLNDGFGECQTRSYAYRFRDRTVLVGTLSYVFEVGKDATACPGDAHGPVEAWPCGIYCVSPRHATNVCLIPESDCHLPNGEAGCAAPEETQTQRDSGAPACGVGNPCNPASGNKFQAETDVTGFPGLIRHYNSILPVNPWSPLGPRWRHEYQARLLFTASGEPNALRGNGAMVRFSAADATRYRAPGHPRLELQRAAGEWLLRDGAERTEIYDELGRLIGIRYPSGRKLILSYENPGTAGGGRGRLREVRASSGGRLTFEYESEDLDARLVSVRDAGGHRVHYGYTAGVLTEVRYPDQTPELEKDDPTREYLYESEHPYALTGIIDERGVRYASWSYHPDGRVASSEHAGGVDRVTLDYAANGTVNVNDWRGEGRRYAFSREAGFARPKRVEHGDCVDCSAGVDEREYDGFGYLRRRVDANGTESIYTHDVLGREQCRIEAISDLKTLLGAEMVAADFVPATRVWRQQWHDALRRPVRRELYEPELPYSGVLVGCDDFDTGPPPGWRLVRRLSYTYHDEQLTSEVLYAPDAVPTQRVTRYSYFRASEGAPAVLDGLLRSIDGPREDVLDTTTFEYHHFDSADAQAGQLARVVDASGQVVIDRTRYDADGRLVAYRDAQGLLTEARYDPRGRVVATIAADRETRYGYTLDGRLHTITAPDRSVIRYDHDDAGRLQRTTDALGQFVEWDLSDPLRIVSIVNDANGFEQTRSTTLLAPDGRVRARQDALDRQVHFEHDAGGNLTDVRDAKSQLTRYGYDALNRRSRIEAADGGVVRMQHDALDRLRLVVDAVGARTEYSYDGLDNLISTLSADSGLTTRQFDAAGNALQRTDARGVVETRSYDALERVTSLEYADPSENISYQYDQGAHGVGRLSSIEDESGRLVFDYDPRGNVVYRQQHTDGHQWSVSYAYDALNRLTAMLYPSGSVLRYQRDALGQVRRVELRDGDTVKVLADDISYPPLGPERALTHGNGMHETRVLDDLYRLETLSVGELIERGHGYDDNDNIIAITDHRHADRSQQFDYDAGDRLDYAKGSYGVLDLGYDLNGNRIRLERDVGVSEYVYAPDSNRLLTITGLNATSYDYLPNGAITSRGTDTLTYNHRGRLSHIEMADGSTASHLYNALGQRVRRVLDGVSRYFIYDLDGALLAEADEGGAIRREYVRANGRIIAVLEPQGPALQAVDPVARLESPDSATVLEPGVMLTWAGAAPDAQVSVAVGTRADAADVLSLGQTSATSAVLEGFNENGEPLYVRLDTSFGGVVFHRHARLKRADRRPRPRFELPAGGVYDAGTQLVWTGGGAQPPYHLWIGTEPGLADIAELEVSDDNAVSVPYLPETGQRLYARLWWQADDVWLHIDGELPTVATPGAHVLEIGKVLDATVEAPTSDDLAQPSLRLTFTLPDSLPDSGLRLYLRSRAVGEQARPLLYLNGRLFGRLEANPGEQRHASGENFDLPADWLRPGLNEIRLLLPAPGASWSLSELILFEPGSTLPVEPGVPWATRAGRGTGLLWDPAGVDLTFPGADMLLTGRLWIGEVDCNESLRLMLNDLEAAPIANWTCLQAGAERWFTLLPWQQQAGENRLHFRVDEDTTSWALGQLELVKPGPALSMTPGEAEYRHIGHGYGSDQHLQSASIEFERPAEPLSLHFRAYAVDAHEKLSVYLNGNLLKRYSFLVKVGSQILSCRQRLDLPEALLRDGTNRLLFVNAATGEPWGLTDLHLLPRAESPPAHIVLDTQQAETGVFGTPLDCAGFTDALSVRFEQPSGAHAVTLLGFDIDRPDEVVLILNGTRIGALNPYHDQQWTPLQFVTLPESLLQAGSNELRIERVGSTSEPWGVQRIGLYPLGEPLRLTVGVMDEAEYGYRGLGDPFPNGMTVEFAGTGHSLELQVQAAFVQAGEVEVLVNGTSLGHLDRTQDNKWGPIQYLLFPKDLLRADNTLQFRASQTVNWWQVRNLLLSPRPELDDAIVPGLPTYAWLLLTMALLGLAGRLGRRAGVLLVLVALGLGVAGDVEAARYRITHVHNDHLGRPIAGTDEAGQVLWSVDYGPFGEVAWSDGEVPEVAGFPGQYRDGVGGAYYNYHRWYEPMVGRYITSDPIGLEGGLNPYQYAGANPVLFVDPYGLEKIFIKDGVTFHAYPKPDGGSNYGEHARHGEGGEYHVHVNGDKNKRWDVYNGRPLTDDEAKYFSKKELKVCKSLTDAERWFVKKATREVFHHNTESLGKLYQKYLRRAAKLSGLGLLTTYATSNSHQEACELDFSEQIPYCD
ncbi:MAG: RHS domain-containing protein [Gammaproteobacteria bacterium]|nr:RHS domain-containing protein [Gammaproteobacteria bacterium]